MIHASDLASATVSAVSCARRGSTSIETRPSTPPVASNTGRSTSQPHLTSYDVISRTASSTEAPRVARFCTWSW
jgi:hypothetical protein